MRGTQIISLAFKDLRYEVSISICLGAGLGAILVPLLVLFGLKHGLVEGLTNELKRDPGSRQIIPVGSGRFTDAWFSAMRAHEGIQFLQPRTRSIAATMWLEGAEDAAEILVDLIPSGASDPLLATQQQQPATTGIYLSEKAATKLAKRNGDPVRAYVSRRVNAREEVQSLELTVLGIVPQHKLYREAALVALDLLAAVEDYRDGYAVPAFGWDGSERTSPRNQFASYRMYATSIEAVAAVEAELTKSGLNVRTRAHEIQLILAVDRNLTLLFWLIGGSAIVGYGVSLSANLVGNVRRKRTDLGLLRLIGFSTLEVSVYPVVQSLIVALCGTAVAFMIFWLIQYGINAHFLIVNDGATYLVCELGIKHLLLACGGSIGTAVAAAGFAAVEASTITPYEGLHNG